MFINRNKENIYQFLSLELAKQNLGSTKSNPSVGCIIEKNNENIITKSFENVPHKFPMYSLSNTYSKKELIQWEERIKKIIGDEERISYSCELKFDARH